MSTVAAGTYTGAVAVTGLRAGTTYQYRLCTTQSNVGHDNVICWDSAGEANGTRFSQFATTSTSGGPTTRQHRLASNIGSVYGTFQSHNSRVAFVPGGGIFVAYLAHWVTSNRCVLASGITRPPKPADGLRDGCQTEMVIARSLDDGHTFHPLLRIKVGGHAPPAVYTDRAGDVIAVVASFMNPGRNDTWVYKFPHGNWAHPIALGAIHYGFDSKFTAAVSPQNTLWYIKGGSGPVAPWGNALIMTRTTIGWGGGTTGVNRCALPTSEDCFLPIATNDPEASNDSGGTHPHYPHLYFDRSSDLALMAWTTTAQCNLSGYYNIHYILSPDGGQRWYGRNGLIPYSSMPIQGGDTGPSWELLSPSEYLRVPGGCASNANWLANIYAQDGHLFFLYGARAANAKFRRVTATFTGSGYTVKNDIGPDTISGVGNGNSGAVFSGTGRAGAKIFLTARTTGLGRAVIVKSSDNDGKTWTTVATGPTLSSGEVYALSGDHGLGPRGQVLAAFTDNLGAKSTVYFVTTVP